MIRGPVITLQGVTCQVDQSRDRATLRPLTDGSVGQPFDLRSSSEVDSSYRESIRQMAGGCHLRDAIDHIEAETVDLLRVSES